MFRDEHIGVGIAQGIITPGQAMRSRALAVGSPVDRAHPFTSGLAVDPDAECFCMALPQGNSRYLVPPAS